MRVLASLAVFAAFGFVAWEVWKKAQAAQVTATTGLQAVSQVANAQAAARPLPFNLKPVLVGGPQAGFAPVVQAGVQLLTGLLKPPSGPASYKVPALGAPVDSMPFSAPTDYTGNVVPSAADLASFGITSPARPTPTGTLNIAGFDAAGNSLNTPEDVNDYPNGFYTV